MMGTRDWSEYEPNFHESIQRAEASVISHRKHRQIYLEDELAKFKGCPATKEVLKEIEFDFKLTLSRVYSVNIDDISLIVDIDGKGELFVKESNILTSVLLKDCKKNKYDD